MRFDMRDRASKRPSGIVFDVRSQCFADPNPHGFDDREWAVWMATFQALREFRPDGQGGEA